VTPTSKGRGRPRREGADEAILAAARELLDETGFAAFNVDVIAERTGIAKTTIYRRWPTKGALVAAAIDETSATNRADILREIEELLGKLEGADLEVLRAVLLPRRERLGPDADAELCRLVMRFLSRHG
jgi:AcrR family transcriptional regulator